MEYTQEIKGKIHSVESFGSVDGPGVRYIVFLQGCHMRCKYCHNPETWAMEGGEELTAKEVFDKAYRYRNYWKKNGGITVSGGEALLQIDFVIALFKLAKEKGVHTTLDTSGNPFTREEPFFSKFNELMKVTDLFMLDIKQIDDEKHKKLIGLVLVIWPNAAASYIVITVGVAFLIPGVISLFGYFGRKRQEGEAAPRFPIADKLEAAIRRDFHKLMSSQSKIAAKAAGRAVDVSADDFDDDAD